MTVVFGLLNLCNTGLSIVSQENIFAREEDDIIDHVMSSIKCELITRIFSCVLAVISTANTAIFVVPALIYYNISVVIERGADLGVICRVNELFFKSLFIGTFAPAFAIISPQLVYQDFDAYKALCYSCAELTSEIISDPKSLDSCFDNTKLVDQGAKLSNWREEFKEVLNADFLEREEIYEIIGDYQELIANFVRLLYNHYEDQEIKNMYGDHYISRVGGESFEKKLAYILKDAILRIKNELIDKGIYTKDEVESIDGGAYTAITEHAILRIIQETTVHQVPGEDKFLTIKFQNLDVTLTNESQFFKTFKRFKKLILNLTSNELELLEKFLNHKKEIDLPEKVKTIASIISGFNINYVKRYLTNSVLYNVPINFGDLFLENQV